MAKVYLCKVNVNNNAMFSNGDMVRKSVDLINRCAMLINADERYE